MDQSSVGTFSEIAYEKPTSANFTYSDETSASGAATGGWKAAGGSAFSKCTGAGGNNWTVGVTAASNKATYTASDNCPALTPNFKYIGSSKAD